MTSQLQIKEAREIAAELQKAICDTGVNVVVNVDDWNDEGSFRVFITFSSTMVSFPSCFNFQANLRKIGWLIKKVINNHRLVEIEFIEMPKRIYYDETPKLFAGYENDYIMMGFRVIEKEVIELIEPKTKKWVQMLL